MHVNARKLQLLKMPAMEDDEVLHLMQLQISIVMNELETVESATRSYMRPIFAQRRQREDFYHLVRELELANSEYFGKYARFTPALLDNVLEAVGPFLEHVPTHRIPITPKEHLMMTIG